jgi:Type II secretion system (T2SS), protein M subtype b
MILRWLSFVFLFFILPATIISLPLWSLLQSKNTEVKEITERISVLKGIVNYGAKVQSQFEPQVDLNGSFLGTESTPVLFATTQTRLRELAEQQALQVYQTNNLPVEILKEGLDKITLRFEVSGTSAALLRFLDAIERSTPILFVENLELKSTDQEAVPSSADTQVFANIEVSGLVAKVDQK